MAPRLRLLTAGLFSIACLATAFLCSPPAHAQAAAGKNANGAKTPKTWSGRFVPDDAFAVILASPQELVQNEVFQSFPVELFRVQMKASFGIDPNDIELAKVVLGLQEDGQPAFGIALELTRPVELETLLELLQAEPEPTEVGELAAYPIAAGPSGTVLHMIDDQTVLFALPTYLEALVAAGSSTKKEEAGKLPSLVSRSPIAPGISVMLAADSIRGVVSEMAAEQARTMPPELLPLAELPELIDTMQVNVIFDNKSGKLTLTMTGIDEDASEQIDDIVTDGLTDIREMMVSMIGQSMPVSGASDEMQDAADAYAKRLTTQIFDAISAKRSGMDVTLVAETEIGIAGGTVLANFMLPMQQIIRSLTRQMDSLNNLRMVMLAMHNYHAAYNRLPAPAITSADGKPLLSWRVAILPFLDEQALYEQFRLDEPWDSEHNLPLSKRMPKVYATAGLRLPPGHTAIHAAVGEEIGLRPKDKTAFRDFLDGLSNTILVIESNADAAVPWSKPADVEIDMEDPLANFIGSPKKSFGVGLGDGAVKRVTDNFDVELFKALLTRAGRERIQPW
jgi:hypothetical protein